MFAVSTTYARPLSIPTASIPAGFVEVPCRECECVVIVPVARCREPVVCQRCRRGIACHEACKLQSDVRALIAGQDPFDALDVAERQEQLDALFGKFNAPKAVPGTLRTVFVPADEPIYDSHGYEPDAVTRDEIEGRIELEPFDADFGASDAGGAFD